MQVQCIVVAKRRLAGPFDCHVQREQCRQGLVGGIFSGKSFPGHMCGRPVAPFQRMDDVVAQHDVAAVLKDVELHRPSAISARHTKEVVGDPGEGSRCPTIQANCSSILPARRRTGPTTIFTSWPNLATSSSSLASLTPRNCPRVMRETLD